MMAVDLPDKTFCTNDALVADGWIEKGFTDCTSQLDDQYFKDLMVSECQGKKHCELSIDAKKLVKNFDANG